MHMHDSNLKITEILQPLPLRFGSGVIRDTAVPMSCFNFVVTSNSLTMLSQLRETKLVQEMFRQRGSKDAKYSIC